MGENSAIEWTDHTFNPWIGCTKVDEGCRNCYAEIIMDTRLGRASWGPRGTRTITSEANWREPIRWNRQAKEDGIRRRVFCASVADVFEDWTGHISSSHIKHEEEGDAFRPVMWHRDDIGICEAGQTTPGQDRGDRPATMADLRRRLFGLIDATPHLDWLLLTKRPENIVRFWPKNDCPEGLRRRENVWLGTSISDQASADKRIPELLQCRALSPVLFLSAEPLRGPVSFRWASWQPFNKETGVTTAYDGLRRIDWIITGFESGQRARPGNPEWVRSIRDECVAAEVPFLFKQWGEFRPSPVRLPGSSRSSRRYQAAPGAPPMAPLMERCGKKEAGRELDGRIWNQFPRIAGVLA